MFDDDNGSASGSAYLFDVSTGAQIDKITPADGEPFDQFGSAVSIDGTTIVFGAWNDNQGTGSAYVFKVPEPDSLSTLLSVVVLFWTVLHHRQ